MTNDSVNPGRLDAPDAGKDNSVKLPPFTTLSGNVTDSRPEYP